MNRIDTDTLRAGQVFSAPVYSGGNNLLVPAMAPLQQRDVDFLYTWGIEAVLTEGHLLTDAEVAAALLEASKPVGLVDLLSSISDVQKNSVPYRAYKTLIEKLDGIFVGIKNRVDMEMRVIDTISVQLLNDLRDYPNNFVGYILGGDVEGRELAKSSVNTAILSALTAQEFHLPERKITSIVSGALLHDVGMFRLSKGITEKKGGLSDAEFEQIKSHPLHSFRIVSKELFGNNEVSLIALHHHERWDGNGYPDHLSSAAIDMGARIVSVADAFEAMVSKKSYRGSMVGYQAVKNILADNARRFDPAVIMAFTRIMGIYPIGSIICLNDESVARVVTVNSNAPLRPVIEMLISKKGMVFQPGEGEIIDLLNEKTLFIKKAIDPAEFAGTNE
jgi:HD-GYP domain-containing protein (c-di-GMP phosphodiesterase class II)